MTSNPRFLAYCRVTGGLDPEATLERDDFAHPGGRMAGYMVWIAERWREWNRANWRPKLDVEAEAGAFEAWLTNLPASTDPAPSTP